MSKRDKYHETVKQALMREGWAITHDPYMFKTDPKLATDLGAERLLAAERGYERIAVEIKSFLRSSQVVDQVARQTSSFRAGRIARVAKPPYVRSV
ncbi:element excision factor XisH family protein [Thiothrix fructosivorans]|uniref:XisH protein n=1 Tax=Thiothrix fructosivorans TaxID=111770 RepID=A0A8B0SLM6_9GAMM|nr:element excision factor XisH family protein [Thiothrix fructosivorans]MBO0615034.1 hypothetical protein [Thiothrix fructosivorans]QTX09832.1 hypothetical protein J1836_014630 [Thiothrix fructosivorans]